MSLADKLDQYGGKGTASRVLGGSSGGSPAPSSGGVNWDAIKAMEDAGYVANPDGTITKPDGSVSDAKKTDTQQNRSEAASARAFAQQYNLVGLEKYIDDVNRGRISWDELEAQLFDPTTKPGKVLDKAYPELRMARENGQTPVSIKEVLDFRQTTKQLVQQLGFGDAITDTNALARDYITSGKSPAELQHRLTAIGDYAEAVWNTNPVAKAKLDELEQYYGVRPTRGDLVAFALNDDFTEATLQKRLQAAAAGAAARTTGFGAIDQGQAETLGSLGVSEDQARQGFGQLAELKGATGELAGQQVDTIGQQDQIDAAFGGNANARRRIARRQREQQALYQTGGGFSQTREGFGGTGTAR